MEKEYQRIIAAEASTINTIINVEEWAADKYLLNPDKSFPQLAKSMEELGEVASALCKKKPLAELSDGIGDVAVTLIILAAQNGLRFEECLLGAWQKIAQRTGRTENGLFIKDEPANQ